MKQGDKKAAVEELHRTNDKHTYTHMLNIALIHTYVHTHVRTYIHTADSELKFGLD